MNLIDNLTPFQRTIGYICASMWLMLNMSFANCQRIVSLTPSISELIQDLGFGQQLVGVTQFCNLKEGVTAQSIGSPLDVNIEKVLRLQPDIVFYSDLNQNQQSTFERLKLNSMRLNQLRIETIWQGASELVTYCTQDETPYQQLLAWKNTWQVMTAQYQPPSSLRVLIIFDSADNASRGQLFYAAGVSFHSDIMEALQVSNAYSGDLSAPPLSVESVLYLQPDVIVFLHNDDSKTLTTQTIQHLPNTWRHVKAYKTGNIFQITGRDTVIPSPRALIAFTQQFIDLLDHNVKF